MDSDFRSFLYKSNALAKELEDRGKREQQKEEKLGKFLSSISGALSNFRRR